jgi:hypothetical protein
MWLKLGEVNITALRELLKEQYIAGAEMMKVKLAREIYLEILLKKKRNRS